MTFPARLPALLLVTLAACSSAVTGHATDAAVDVPSDALAACLLPNGTPCARGSTCPAGDGCNVCSCAGTGSMALCTLRACAPDAGPRACSTRADCGSGEFCSFPATGCAAVGTCQPATPCAESVPFCACDGGTYLSCSADRPTRSEGSCAAPDAGGPTVCFRDSECGSSKGYVCQFVGAGCGIAGRCGSARDCAAIVPYCGCDGQTFMDCPGGTTSRAYRASGACVAEDGGVSPACVGAHIGRDLRSCVGAADEPLPTDCCTWNCDTRTASCESLPPPCAAGRVNTVAGACWGPCVAPTSCAPMRCSSASDCVTPWRCDATAGLCAYPG